jgi:hypothetical protein
VTRLTTLLTLLGGSLAIPLLVTPSAQAECYTNTWREVTSTGIVVHEETICEDGGGHQNENRQTNLPAEVQQMYRTPACFVNGPPPGDPGAMCPEVTSNPLCADDEFLMRIYVRMVDRVEYPPIHEGGGWEYLGTSCVGPGEEASGLVPIEITVEMVMDHAQTTAPTPELHMQPPTASTVVNIPNNFYVQAERSSETLTVLGVAVPVTYTPVSHAWAFGDGEVGSGAGIENAEVGQGGAVEHVYLRRGDYEVTVTTSYSVTFRIPGQGEVTPDGTIEGTSDALPVEVLEIQSVVTGVG